MTVTLSITWEVFLLTISLDYNFFGLTICHLVIPISSVFSYLLLNLKQILEMLIIYDIKYIKWSVTNLKSINKPIILAVLYTSIVSLNIFRKVGPVLLITGIIADQFWL